MSSSEDAEVAALDRVLTRTVMTKDEDLQQVGRRRVQAGAAVGMHGQFAHVGVLFVCVDPCGYRLCCSCRALCRSRGASGNASACTHTTSSATVCGAAVLLLLLSQCSCWSSCCRLWCRSWPPHSPRLVPRWERQCCIVRLGRDISSLLRVAAYPFTGVSQHAASCLGSTSAGAGL